jgi:hypothetical protein
VRHARRSLAEYMVAIGDETEMSAALDKAGRHLCLLLALEIVTPKKLDEYERDAQVYYLRSHGVDTEQIRKCYSVSRQWVHECIKRHIKRLRAAMRGENEGH